MRDRVHTYFFFQKSRVIFMTAIVVLIPFQGNYLMNIALDFFFFLLGVHIFYFLKYWIDWQINLMDGYLKRQPEWYQRGMACQKNPRVVKIFFIGTAVLCIFSFILNFI